MPLRPEGGYQPTGDDGDGAPKGPTPKGGSSVSPPQGSGRTQTVDTGYEIVKFKAALNNLETMAGVITKLLQLLVDRGIKTGELHGTERALALSFIDKITVLNMNCTIQQPVGVRWEHPLDGLSAYTVVRTTEKPEG